MRESLAMYERFVKDFRVFLNEREGEIHRFKARLTFIDDSVLFIKEYGNYSAISIQPSANPKPAHACLLTADS